MKRTIYYNNFSIFYDAYMEKLHITKFDRNMKDFKDSKEDRYESHVKWYETYERENIPKCDYLPKEIVDLSIQKGLDYEKYQQNIQEKREREAETNSLDEIFFEIYFKYGFSRGDMESLILEHKKNGKKKYNIDLPGVEYYEELLNKYWS